MTERELAIELSLAMAQGLFQGNETRFDADRQNATELGRLIGQAGALMAVAVLDEINALLGEDDAHTGADLRQGDKGSRDGDGIEPRAGDS